MQYVDRKHKPTLAEKKAAEAAREAREAELAMKNKRLGLTIFQGSWIMVFVCLLVIHWQMGFSDGWRPTAEQAPNALLPTLATIGLVVSGWFAHRGWKIAETTDPAKPQRGNPPFLQPWRIAIGLGVAFFLVMLWQYIVVPTSPDGEQFGYVYRLMIGYHAIHAIVIGAMMIQVLRLSKDGRYHAENYWSVEASAKLWYFVIVAWLMFYVVLYLPYLF